MCWGVGVFVCLFVCLLGCLFVCLFVGVLGWGVCLFVCFIWVSLVIPFGERSQTITQTYDLLLFVLFASLSFCKISC